MGEPEDEPEDEFCDVCENLVEHCCCDDLIFEDDDEEVFETHDPNS